MIPVVTPEEMAAIDGAAPEPVEVLIGRAGSAVARAALDMLGGGYGRRVVVLAGPGNNGADGRDAARRLERRGVRVQVHELAAMPDRISGVDLVIDAVLGTGARPGFVAPTVAAGIPVLAVDLPSGVAGLTGEAREGVLAADRTVTFAALKPGLLFEPGRALAGDVQVADIGLDASSATVWALTDSDVAQVLPHRSITAHKWHSAVWAIAGSHGMTGAAHLVVRAAQRSGAGYVRLSSPGVDDDPMRPTEAVGVPLSRYGWAQQVLRDLDRFECLVVGPGLGREPSVSDEIINLVVEARLPIVIDGDGLTALGEEAAWALADRSHPTVLTPHDGEFDRLSGAIPGANRLAAARRLADDTRSIVLLKGSTTVVAHPNGQALVVTSGDSRLATAGTGDVLSGIIAGLIAAGVEPFSAAAAGAHLHGCAGTLGSAHGLVAGDLVDHLPFLFDQFSKE